MGAGRLVFALLEMTVAAVISVMHFKLFGYNLYNCDSETGMQNDI